VLSDEDGLAAARSVSRLVHRHVEAIHQVGRDGDIAYVAAEYVPGQSLEAWAHGQTSTAVARCLKQAADGLRAAHDAGVVHGRIASESIRVDANGEPKLVAFGFARGADTKADDRAGLYAAFVAALSGAATPAWLAGPLERQLDLAVLDRELAKHLERPSTFNGQSVALLGIAAGVIMIAWPREEVEPAPTAEPCTDGADELANVWGPERQRAIQDAIVATGARSHPRMWDQVRTQMGAWTEAWSAAYLASCEATRVLETQSEEQYALRTECLMQLRDQAAVLSDALAATDAKRVTDLTSQTYRLPKVERCQSRAGFDAGVGELASPLAREIVGEIGMAKAKMRISQFDEARELLERAGDKAEQAELWYLASDSHRELATFANRNGDHASAGALADETLAHAERSGVPNEIVWAWQRIAEIAMHAGDGEKAAFSLQRATSLAEGYDVGEDVWVGLYTLRGQLRFGAGQPSEAADDFIAAAKLVEKLGMDPGLAIQASYDAIAPLVHAGRPDEAKSIGEAGLRRADEVFGPGHILASGLQLQLAQLALQTGDLDRGLELSKLAMEGPDPSHPYYPQLKLGGAGVYAHALHRKGRTKEAVPALRATLEELQPKVGAGSPILATTQTHLADMLVHVGKADEAATLLEGVVAAAEKHPLTDPLNLSAYKLALATAQAEAGQTEAAEKAVEGALVASAKGTAEMSNSRFATLVSAGETLMKIGNKDRAREVFLQARPIMEAAEVDPVNKKIVVESLAELGVE